MPPARRSPSKHRRSRSQAKGAHPAGQPRLRIIGGLWRSRQVGFPPVEGLRPTPDRVRETLFNWLAGEVPGSRCLDLFAGSGALGLEALSREAAEVVFVDTAAKAVSTLRDNLAALDCDRGQVVSGDAMTYLDRPGRTTFDIIFLDPPFRRGWLERIVPRLAEGGWLGRNGWVYIEHEAELANLPVPGNWLEYRRKDAGQVVYRLFQVTVPENRPSSAHEGTP